MIGVAGQHHNVRVIRSTGCRVPCIFLSDPLPCCPGCPGTAVAKFGSASYHQQGVHKISIGAADSHGD